MLEQLFYYLQGYLILELCGDSKERFINLCKNREIEIIHIFVINSTWFCKIKCCDYKEIRTLLKKTGCRISIQKKCGLPFDIRKLKKRKGLIAGSILFILIMLQCSSRIWHISVEGGFIHTREQMLQVLQQELGVYGGVPAKLVDCFEIEKRLRLDYNEIGWISVEKKGCRVCVCLNESTMPKKSETQSMPCHIIAEQDGIVQKMEVKTGIPKVKTGDAVKKGDILISGIVPIVGDFDELIRLDPVVATGEVHLKSEFSYLAKFPIVYEQKNYTDSRLGLDFFWFHEKIFSYIPRYSDGKYDIMSIDIVPYVFDDCQVPVLFRKYRLLQYDSELVTMTKKEAEEKAKASWEEFLTDWRTQGVDIITAEFSSEIKQKVCEITGTVTACGNFISYQEIKEEEWKTENEYRGDNP